MLNEETFQKEFRFRRFYPYIENKGQKNSVLWHILGPEKH